MTDRQRTKLMSQWWPAACAAQGWDAKDRQKRLQVFGEAVGRELVSASDLDAHADIDRVKAHLFLLAAPENLGAAMQTVDEDSGERRRLIWSILQSPRQYIESIVHDLTHGTTTEIDELTLPQLRKLAMTLTERRRAAQRRRIQEEAERSGVAANSANDANADGLEKLPF